MAFSPTFRQAALVLLLAAACAAQAAETAFARVGDTVISHEDFDSAFAQAARSKFYHGKPPENAVAALQREVAQNLVDEVLLSAEAKRRKLSPDDALVAKTLAGYEQRYGRSEQWKANRERLLPGLRAKLERDSLVEQLTTQVKTVSDPTPAQLEAYWATHQDKFTSPEQVRVSMILLKVDPSSPQAKWEAAGAEGAAIVKRLQGGADFAELAKLHSGDGSADRGGDLGYVHHGMLPDPAQQAVDKLKPGQVSDAVLLLEGVGVFRLQDRIPAKLNPLADVQARARDLWKRDRGDEAWAALLARLRSETPTRIDDTRFLPLDTAAR